MPPESAPTTSDRVHDLKTLPVYFEPLWSCERTAELRNDDRGFAVGDMLKLREYVPEEGRYTGRFVLARITHRTPPGCEYCAEGYAMLSFQRIGRFNGGPQP